MDFTFTEDQTTVRELAHKLYADHCTPEALRAAEDSTTPGFDGSLWAKLADAGLLGTAIPDAHGGLGLGLLEVTMLLEQTARAAAPVPVFAAAVSALALVRHGSAAQQAALLPGLADGSVLISPALVEPLGEELAPTATASADGRITGTKTCVPSGMYADKLLVSATSPEGPRLYLVDAADVTREAQVTITYVPEALVVLDGVQGELVGDATTLADVLQVAQVAVCALQLGTADAALRLTADYTKTREQFGHPIAHFQAVGQRAADSFIDTTTIKLTMLQAAWLLAERLPAAKEVAVAKYFASDGGQRVVRACAHLHGGMGVSREYPLHRYYLAAKQYELTLGGGTRSLVSLGRLLAEETV
jgi:alkylation response protein AidB-like acyl-CoA dehydrogenase